MNRITAKRATLSNSSEALQVEDHSLLSDRTVNAINDLTSPQMRQLRHQEHTGLSRSSGADVIRHPMGSASFKRRVRAENAIGAPAVFSEELRSMSASALADKLMRFDKVQHGDWLMQWDSWLLMHGASIFLLAQMIRQAEYIGHLQYALSADAQKMEPQVRTDTSAILAHCSRRQCLLLFTQLIGEMARTPTIHQHDHAMLPLQLHFLAGQARAARPDLGKLFRYQLPKVLGGAVWPDMLDEQKLRSSLDAMGTFGMVADVMVSIVKIARKASTQSMAGMQEDVQAVLRHTLQAELGNFALDAVERTSITLLDTLEKKGYPLEVGRFLLEQFYLLTSQQFDAIRRAFGILSARSKHGDL